MLDKNLIRKNPDFYKKKLKSKGVDEKDFDLFLKTDKLEKSLLKQLETLNFESSNIAKEIGKLKAAKKDVPASLFKKAEAIKKETESVSNKHKEARAWLSYIYVSSSRTVHNITLDYIQM